MWFVIGMIALQAFSQVRAGQAQAAQLKAKQRMTLYNAKIAEADAAAARRKTDFEQTRAALEAEQIAGRLRVRQGASGARTDVGSPLLIRAQQWAESELDNFLIGLEGRTRVSRFESEAALERVQADVYGQSARNARRAGYLGAGTTILGGLGSMYAGGVFSSGATASAPASLTTARGPAGMGF